MRKRDLKRFEVAKRFGLWYKSLLPILIVASSIYLFFVQVDKTFDRTNRSYSPLPTYNIEVEQLLDDAAVKSHSDNEPSLPDSQITNFCGANFSSAQYLDSLSYQERVKRLLVPVLSYGNTKTALNGSMANYAGYVLVETAKFASAAEINSDLAKISSGSTIPAWRGVDAEGGVTKRFQFGELKPLSSLKYLSNELFCSEIGEQAAFIKSAGFNWALAPVLDIAPDSSYWIYARTIGSSPQTTGEVGQRYIDCMRTQGILTSPKHYPGHGATALDSHKLTPVIDKPFNEWSTFDRIPFDTVIAAGADSIMVGHLIFQPISNEVSSQSGYWMKDILRGVQKYQNLIVTDDIAMLKPVNSEACADLISISINNGADLVLFVHQPRCSAPELLQYIEQKQLLDDSVLKERFERIAKIKRQYLCGQAEQ